VNGRIDSSVFLEDALGLILPKVAKVGDTADLLVKRWNAHDRAMVHHFLDEPIDVFGKKSAELVVGFNLDY
jgi:hypothetical protein